jgi:hypothetical protein
LGGFVGFFFAATEAFLAGFLGDAFARAGLGAVFLTGRLRPPVAAFFPRTFAMAILFPWG